MIIPLFGRLRKCFKKSHHFPVSHNVFQSLLCEGYNPSEAKHSFPFLCKLCMLDQTIKLNPFPNNPWFLRVYSTCLLKTLQEMKKLLIMSNLSFSHSVFYLFGELSDFFMCLQYMSFENTAGNEEIAHNEQFLLFPQCFLPIWRTF